MTRANVLVSNDVGQKDRARELRQTFDLGAKLVPAKQIPADFVWFPHGKRYGIELKVGTDLLGSLGSQGRLGGQVRQMVEGLDFGVILIHGGFEMDPATGKLLVNMGRSRVIETNWQYRSVMGMLADVQMAGVHVEQWNGPGIVERIAAWVINTCEGDHAWLKGRTRPSVMALAPSYNNAIWSLCSHTGIGPELAQALLRKHGPSVAEVYYAAMEAAGKVDEPRYIDLKDGVKWFMEGVKGLGAKKAETFIREATGG